MPPSKPPYIKLSLSFFACALLLLWFNQDSLENYWQQQYHRPGPLAGLRQYDAWMLGSRWRAALFNDRPSAADDIPVAAPAVNNIHTAADTHTTILPAHEASAEPHAITDTHSTTDTSTAAPPAVQEVPVTTATTDSPHTAAHTDEAAAPAAGGIDTPPISLTSLSAAPVPLPENTATAPETAHTPGTENSPADTDAVPAASLSAADDAVAQTDPTHSISLQAGDEVLFIGDSMMQSFAPHMQKWLKNQHGINSFNLARHSTGLSNQAYYDWPQQAALHFAEHPQLKLVVVMMGANDPWNIETADKRLLAFKSPEWVQEYADRALRIVSAAKAQGAQVIWIGLPPMRLVKYDAKIRFLDDTLAAQLAGHALYIRSRPLFDNGSGSYQDSIKHQGTLLRVRHKDGIHLNSAGELLLLEAVKARLQIAPPSPAG